MRAQYSAFISYSHRDSRWAVRLHRFLERYRVPRHLWGRDTAFGPLEERLPPVFRDRDELATSSDLAESVRSALMSSATLVVICSPNAAKSAWVDQEIRSFIGWGREARIRLIIVDGEPHSGDPATECLPPAVREMRTEPLAADIRPDRDGAAGARLKVLAGIIDVPFDELRQREAQRRMRRLLALAAGSFAGFLLTGGLAVYALVQREMAEQRTLTAERTLEFVKSMFEVADPSRAKGATITARDVVDSGAKMLDEGLENEPAVKAELQVTLAEVYGALGEYQRSDQLVRDSLSIKHGQSGIRARQYAALGDSQFRLGDFAAAERNYRLALDELDGDDGVVAQALRSQVLVGLGQSLSALESFEAADRYLREALRLDRDRVGARHSDVARDIEALGLNWFYAGDAEKARPLIREALQMRRSLEGPRSPSVSDNLNTLGSLAYQEGDLAAAEDYFRQILAIDEQVLGPDHPDLAATINNLARVELEQRDLSAADPLLQRAIRIDLAQGMDGHEDMAFLFSSLAIVRREQGRSEEAERLFRRALGIARSTGHRSLGQVMTDLADLHCRTGRAADGLAVLRDARGVMSREYPDEAWRTAWVENVMGECLYRLGRIDEARRSILRSDAAIMKRWNSSTLIGAATVRRRALVS